MNAAVICFSDAGAELAEKISEVLGADIHSSEKYSERYGFIPHRSIMADTGTLFADYSALIFIGSCGIAVRCIAPHVKSKTCDPAVIVTDDAGSFVIPLLSGHIGGANALARKLAEILGAVPVITTATDVHGRFACDEWAARHGCAISSMKAAKEISAAILTEDIPVCSDFALPEKLPAGLIRGETGRLGIYIGVSVRKPFDTTLSLIPRTVTAGIGCRRGTAREPIALAVSRALEENGIDERAVKRIASIDLKKDEEGLLAYAGSIGITPVFYSADMLNAVPGEFPESEFVRKTTGTGNVCGRAAACEGGEIIAHKTVYDGVTVALAREEWEIEF